MAHSKSNRPLGIVLITISYIVIGLMTFLSSTMEVFGSAEFRETLNRSNVPIFLYFITNLILPLAMVIFAVALWNRKALGWLGVATISAISILVYIFLPLIKYGPESILFILQNAIRIAIPIIILVYLLSKRVMEAYGLREKERKKALTNMGIISVVIGALLITVSPNPRDSIMKLNEEINQQIKKE